MPKRKRDHDASVTDGAADGIQDPLNRIEASRLKAKVAQCNKSLKNALQLARGFERQKLGRRQKQAEQNPHTLLRLREEVIVIRELDPAKIAKNYLFKQLVKTKKIRESAAFVALYGSDPKLAGPKSVAEANVLGRLFKSNPVKEVLPDLMQGVRDVLGLEDTNSLPPNPTRESRGVHPQSNPMPSIVDEDVLDLSDEEGSPLLNAKSILPEGLTLEGLSEKDRRRDDTEIRSDDREEATSGEDEDVFAAYADRLGGSSDDSSTDDMSLDRSDGNVKRRTAVESAHSDTEASNESDIESRLKPRKQRPTPAKISSTAFLPSLSMGGYYSGSESDVENYDKSRDRDARVIQTRKNRRGQRARREIAEKKYGQNAKHLNERQQQQQDRNGVHGKNAGWDPKRGATDGRNGKKFGSGGGQGRSKAGSSDQGPTGANGDAVNPDRAKRRNGVDGEEKKKASNAPLHPSWEAARKKKIETSVASYSGKKTTFND